MHILYILSAAAAAESHQSCPTLFDTTEGSPSGSPVPGILQARTLEWVAISFSNAWKWKVKVKLLSRARLLVTPGTAAYQAPPSMGFSRQEYWSGVPLPSCLDRIKCQFQLKYVTNTKTQYSVGACVQFSHSIVSDSLRLHGLQHARLPCPSPIPGACSNLCPSSQWYQTPSVCT